MNENDSREIRTPGRPIPQSPHFGCVGSFLRWWYTRRPPGVFTTRRRLEVVLYGWRLRSVTRWAIVGSVHRSWVSIVGVAQVQGWVGLARLSDPSSPPLHYPYPPKSSRGLLRGYTSPTPRQPNMIERIRMMLTLDEGVGSWSCASNPSVRFEFISKKYNNIR